MNTEQAGEEVIVGDRDISRAGARPRSSNSLPITLIVIGLALIFTSLASYWYLSPVLAVRSMRAAAVAGDGDTFNSYVDYPKLRESLKGHLMANLAKMMESRSGDSDASRAGASLGAMLGAAMVNNLVDAMVRPEVVMQSLKEGQLGRGKAAGASSTGSAGTDKPDTAGGKTDPDWATERIGMDKYIVHLREPGKAESMLSVVFERNGFASWKLTELRPNFPS